MTNPDNAPQESNPKKSKQNKGPNDFYRYSGMAIKMALVIGLCVWGGISLDSYFNSQSPWITITLSMLGVAAAIYVVISDTSKP